MFDASSLSVDVSDNAVLAIDGEGRIIYFNSSAEALLGYSRDEMIGKSSEILFAEPDRADHVARRKRSLSDPDPRSREHVREMFSVHKAGHKVHLSRTIVLVETEHGPIVIATLKDLTDRDERDQREGELRHRLEELEAQLARRTVALDENIDDLEAVSYAVFHDLQAPLRAMQTYAQTVLAEEGDSFHKSAREFMTLVIDAVTRMDALSQRVLDYRRVLRTELTMHPIGVRESFNEVLGYLSPYVHESKAQVSIKGPPATVLADRDTLLQVLANLVTNAIKFASPERIPRVTLGAERRHTFVKLWVEDNGVGIRETDGERIFRMFERVYSPGQPRGSGIGLTIVKRGVERMNGRVGMESKPGKGSRFWLELPAG